MFFIEVVAAVAIGVWVARNPGVVGLVVAVAGLLLMVAAGVWWMAETPWWDVLETIGVVIVVMAVPFSLLAWLTWWQVKRDIKRQKAEEPKPYAFSQDRHEQESVCTSSR